MDGSVIAAVAANAHRPADAPLANDVTARIVQQLQVPATATDAARLADCIRADRAARRRLHPDHAAPTFPNQFLGIQLLDKVAVVVRRLRLVGADCELAAHQCGRLPAAWTSPQLPVTGAQPRSVVVAAARPRCCSFSWRGCSPPRRLLADPDALRRHRAACERDARQLGRHASRARDHHRLAAR